MPYPCRRSPPGKGFNLEWSDKTAEGVVEAQQKLESSSLLVKDAVVPCLKQVSLYDFQCLKGQHF